MKRTSMLTFPAITDRFKRYLFALKLVSLLLLINLMPTPALAVASVHNTGISKVTEGTQKQKISGVITDAETKQPLVGVSVANLSTNGQKFGTVTDLNGKFSLDVADVNSTLVITYIGYEKQEIKPGTSTFLSIELKPVTTSLNEVVVIGYGKTRRGDLTSAQTTVTSKDLERTVNTTVEQALQGRAAGVYVTQNSGQPGGGISINIRGVSSINGSTEPLYVVDGVQIQGQSVSNNSNLSWLNTADIESVSVLQGPSATAIYGSRATNGVVLITTKSGKAGDTKLTYDVQYNIQEPPKSLHVMNLREYGSMVNQFKTVAGGTIPGQFLDPTLLGNGTDWQHELFKATPMIKHQLSMSGGNDKTTYFMSGEYMNQDGVALGSGFKRYGFRLKVDNKPREWATIGANLSFNQTDQNITTSQGDVISNALQLSPQVPVKNFDGTWAGGDTTNGANTFAPVNPIAISSLTTNTNTNRQFLGGLNISLKLMKGLTFTTSLNGNIGYTNSTYYQPTYSIGWAKVVTATLNNGTGMNTYWNLNQMLQYYKQIGKHTFDLMVGHESQESKWKNVGASRTGFLTNDIYDLNAGDPLTSNNTGGSGPWAMESYLGRLSYNYNDRYLLMSTLRRDGSANFGDNNKWGYFPSLSFAWRLSKEKFFNVPFVSDLKLRFETGTTGNSGGGGIYSPMGTGATPNGTGFLPNKYANPDYKWENTKTDNIGLNVAFLKNRISVEFDYYVKKTTNLIMDALLPWYMGTNGTGSVSPPTVNLGAMQNKGWSLTINTTNVVTKDFKWESNFNLSSVKTTITKFYSNVSFANRTSWWMDNWTQRAQVGSAPWLFRGYIADGLFQTVDEINKSAVPVDNAGNRLPTDAATGVWVGDVKFKDISGPNGVPDGKIDSYDETNIGNPWPKMYGGFTNSFSYKGFELSVLITATLGNDIYNYIARVNSNPNNINLSRNLLIGAMDYARPITDAQGQVVLANPNTTVARISYGPNGNYTRITDKWVEDGSFVRIKNISFSYNLPANLISKLKMIKGVRLAVGVQNIATITGYKGYDPEVGSYVGANTSAGTQAIGVDNGRYPLTPIYTFNLGVNF